MCTLPTLFLLHFPGQSLTVNQSMTSLLYYMYSPSPSSPTGRQVSALSRAGPASHTDPPSGPMTLRRPTYFCSNGLPKSSRARPCPTNMIWPRVLHCPVGRQKAAGSRRLLAPSPSILLYVGERVEGSLFTSLFQPYFIIIGCSRNMFIRFQPLRTSSREYLK